MAQLLKIEDIDVVELYPYPSVVLYVISKYDDAWSVGNGDEKVKKLFETVLDKANKEHNNNFMDNKIAFKFIHKPTNTTMFIGYKDGIYRLGLGVKQQYDSKIIL